MQHRIIALAAAAALATTGSAFAAHSGLALTAGGDLVNFDIENPGTVLNTAPVSGLAAGETLLAIDVRPATGELFGLGSGSNLYTVDAFTGAATQVGSTFMDALNGSSFGFDFNPVIDRIRIVSDLNQNLVANPNNGVANAAETVPVFYADGDVNAGEDPDIIGSAYINSGVGPAPAATQLYGIDAARNVLVEQANNAGTLTTNGPLGLDVGGLGGFDIFTSPDGVNTAYASFGGVSGSQLYELDLDTGLATLDGTIGGGEQVIGLAVSVFEDGGGAAVVPLPSAALAFPAVAGIAAFAGRRLRKSSTA